MSLLLLFDGSSAQSLPASVSFAGSGTAAMSATAHRAASLACAGVGTSGFVATVQRALAVQMAGSGTADYAATVHRAAAVAFSGSSSCEIAGTVTRASAVAFAGSGTFAAAAAVQGAGAGSSLACAVDFAGAGTLSLDAALVPADLTPVPPAPVLTGGGRVGRQTQRHRAVVSFAGEAVCGIATPGRQVAPVAHQVALSIRGEASVAFRAERVATTGEPTLDAVETPVPVPSRSTAVVVRRAAVRQGVSVRFATAARLALSPSLATAPTTDDEADVETDIGQVVPMARTLVTRFAASSRFGVLAHLAPASPVPVAPVLAQREADDIVTIAGLYLLHRRAA